MQTFDADKLRLRCPAAGDKSADIESKEQCGGKCPFTGLSSDGSSAEKEKIVEDSINNGKSTEVKPLIETGSVLPRWERMAYWVIFIVCYSRAIWGLYEYTRRDQVHAVLMENKLLRPRIFGLMSDDTMSFWFSSLEEFAVLIPYSLTFLVISRIARHFGGGTVQSIIYLTAWLVTFTYLFSAKVTLLIVGLTAFYIALSSKKLTILRWFIALSLFYLRETYAYLALPHSNDNTDLQFYNSLLLMAMPLLFCRLISLSDSLGEMEHRTINTYLISYHYITYFPNFFCGPLITFNDFHKQMITPTPISYKLQFSRTLRIIFWLFIGEIGVAIFRPSATLYYSWMGDLDRHQAVAVVDVYSKLFYMLHIGFYGIAGVLTALDGIEVVTWPACTTYVYLYSDMWRLFDKGLYVFMKYHVYIPLMGNGRGGVFRKIFATLGTFGLVLFYHHWTVTNVIWIGINTVQMFGEQLVIYIFNETKYGQWIKKTFSPQAIQRLGALMASQSLQISIYAISFFFFHTAGYPFVEKMLYNGGNGILNYILYINLVCYTLVNISIDIKPYCETSKKKLK